MFDYHVHPEVDGIKMAETAKMLGWSGLCLVVKNERETETYRKPFSGVGLDVSFGLQIETNRPDQIKKTARENRKRFELILVKGGSAEINRAACETPEVDILTHTESVEGSFGYVTANLARENNVHVEFNFRNLLMSYKRTRAETFSRMLEIAKLVRKFKAPFTITTGSLSSWDMRAPSELASFGRVLGFDGKSVNDALSGKIIDENRKRLGRSWVMPGVSRV